MSDSFEVVQSSSEDGLSEEKRREVVAAQLRGEARAAGRPAEAVGAAVAAELEAIGLEPDPAELHRRYEEVDPDVPELTEAADDVPPAESGTGAVTRADDDRAEGPVSAGLDTSREQTPVDDAQTQEQAGREVGTEGEERGH